MKKLMNQVIKGDFAKTIKRKVEYSQEITDLLKISSVNAQNRFFKTDSLVQAEQTPFEVIYQEDIIKLRYYPPLNESEIEVDGETLAVNPNTHRIPLVLVAPLAVNMYIYDLFQDRSLVKYLRARGFELYLVDWGRPGWKQNHFTIETYVAKWLPKLIDQVKQHSGSSEVSLHGWSFGGLFSACYGALDQQGVKNLALIGAPCDYHANGQLGVQYQRISRNMKWLERRTGWKVHNTRQRWWRSPGWVNSMMFKLTNPVGSIKGYVDLLKNLHDEEYVTSHATNGAFLDDMVAYPGAVIQDVIQFLWVENRLAKGELPLRNDEVSFSNVTADMLLVSGKQDPIVTTDCTQRFMDLVSSKTLDTHEVKGGHMGILSGSNAPKDIWPVVADWLEARSQ
jgi:class III poly(R)-hydroxyalkanoic acid synthase PhaC subunit